ncbi:DUF4258 domain-containing protein [Methanogenium sp. MK-MG]|uniref:DUF4258 domain-containing protein n=1 Tax=Methanogenium sp. MK-MG TaxID=2599926 RepID=UPI0013EA960A|nr:DUF4258 domain-containing protein [Methanogenium sp. MK-MG]KAF1074657.1 hypothetical protein MKMG_01914 [Methanogenium sp. MK-MG]
MKTSRKFVLALTGLAMLCVCAAMAAPLTMGDGPGRGDMQKMSMQKMIQQMQENGTCQDGACDGSKIHFALQRMAANGIDTTDLETALENGDREAVHAFLQEKRPADAPTKGERMQKRYRTISPMSDSDE